MNLKAKQYIDQLQLSPHPEGGYFREVYRSDETLHNNNLPSRYASPRAFSTSIYFLLEGSQVSKFHKLKSDEQWHFYHGSAFILYTIDKDGLFNKTLVGSKIEDGEVFQANIKRGTWFGAEIKDKTSFALAGCTVTPGFDFNDFELAKREKLLKDFPAYRDVIIKLTD